MAFQKAANLQISQNLPLRTIWLEGKIHEEIRFDFLILYPFQSGYFLYALSKGFETALASSLKPYQIWLMFLVKVGKL